MENLNITKFNVKDLSNVIYFTIVDAVTEETLHTGTFKGNRVPLSERVVLESLSKKKVIYATIWESGNYGEQAQVVFTN